MYVNMKSPFSMLLLFIDEKWQSYSEKVKLAVENYTECHYDADGCSACYDRYNFFLCSAGKQDVCNVCDRVTNSCRL